MIRLHAVLYALRVDREGETRITLEVPLNQLPEAAKLCGAIQKVLDVTLQEVPSGVIGGHRVSSPGVGEAPLPLTVEAMDDLRHVDTLERLAQIWQEIINRDTGIWKRLPEADKESLMLVKNQRKAELEEAMDTPL